MKTSSIIVFALSLLLTMSCKESKKNSSVKTAKIEFKKEATLQLYKAKTDSLISTLDVELAETDYETQTGLMYRATMKKNHGMLFIFKGEQPRSFYMKNTQIPLDIIYLNKNKEIVSIQKNAKAMDETSLPSNKPAKYVLEVNAGLSDAWQLKIGDYIKYNKL